MATRGEWPQGAGRGSSQGMNSEEPTREVMRLVNSIKEKLMDEMKVTESK